MNNAWNKTIYKVWSPVYDRFFNAGPFAKARKRVFNDIPFKKGDKVLFVGVGTGADFSYISYEGISVTAVDISPEMLARAKANVTHPVTFLEMDAQQLEFPDESFDWVVASLILSVVPDAERCISEMVRVARRGGHILVFDKFEPKGGLSPVKKLIRPVISLLGTDIGRSFEKLMEPHRSSVKVESDQPVLFGGMFRKVVIRVTK